MSHLFRSQYAAATYAFLVAPVGPAAWGVLWSILWGKGDAFGPAGFALLFYLVTLPMGIVLGPPVLFLLARYWRLEWWTAVIVGIIAGTAISALLHLPLSLYAPVGPAWAALFYLVWKGGPDANARIAIQWGRGFYRRRP